MSAAPRLKKVRYVAPPLPPIPGWMLQVESRATAAGFKSERCKSTHFDRVEWWLSIQLSPGTTISLFGPKDNFILSASVQNITPRELMARTQVLLDVLEMVAPDSYSKASGSEVAF